MSALNEVEKAYLAGFIDGEGTITICKHKVHGCPRGFLLTPRIHVANTDPKLLKIHKQFCSGFGSLFVHESRRHPSWKRCYRIDIQRKRQVAKLLNAILPYLILKKEQTKLVLEFIKSREKQKTEAIRNPKNGCYLGSKRKDYTSKEMEIFEQVSKLNKRGAAERMGLKR